MENKGFLRSVLAGLLSVTCLVSVSAQSYEPTSTWPYLLPDFTDGILHKTVGADTEGKFNIHLLEGRLHFIEGEFIREALPGDVFSVMIGNDIFVNAGGRMMKVLAKSENGFVGEDTLVDMQALNATGGAYGSSSNSMATTALSSVDGIGGKTNTNHMELKNTRDNGKILPLLKKKYLVYDGKIVFAVRKDVEGLDGLDKKDFREFCKAHKIKWNNPESLLEVLDYVSCIN